MAELPEKALPAVFDIVYAELTRYKLVVQAVLFGALLVLLLWGPLSSIVQHIVNRAMDNATAGSVLVADEAPQELHARRRERMQARVAELQEEGVQRQRESSKMRLRKIKEAYAADDARAGGRFAEHRHADSVGGTHNLDARSTAAELRTQQDELYAQGLRADASRLEAQLRREERVESARARLREAGPAGVATFEVLVRSHRGGSKRRTVTTGTTLQALMDWLELDSGALGGSGGLEGLGLALPFPTRVLCSWRDFRVIQRDSGIQAGLDESTVSLSSGDVTLGSVGVTGMSVIQVVREEAIAVAPHAASDSRECTK